MKTYPINKRSLSLAFPDADQDTLDMIASKAKGVRANTTLEVFDLLLGTLGVVTNSRYTYLKRRRGNRFTIFFDDDASSWGIALIQFLEDAPSFRFAASGLYGYTKTVERACTASLRSLERAADKIAKNAYAKDPRVAAFLATHASRGDSIPAKILVSSLKKMGPKFAKAAASKGVYGFHQKTVRVGLNACTDIRFEAGRIASVLHARKKLSFDSVRGFYQKHAEDGQNMYARILNASFPEEGSKTASTLGDDWIKWEEE